MKDFEKMDLSQLEKELTKRIKGEFEYQSSVLKKELNDEKLRLDELTKKTDKTSDDEEAIKALLSSIDRIEDDIDKFENEARKKAIISIESLDQFENELKEEKSKRTFLRAIPIKTPLTMIALFVTILELAALGVLPQLLKIEDSSKTLLRATELASFMNFIIWFPVFVVSAFFITLLLKPNALYAPSDFKDENHFMELYKIKSKMRGLSRELNNQKEASNNLVTIFESTKTREDNMNFNEENSKLIEETRNLLK